MSLVNCETSASFNMIDARFKSLQVKDGINTHFPDGQVYSSPPAVVCINAPPSNGLPPPTISTSYADSNFVGLWKTTTEAHPFVFPNNTVVSQNTTNHISLVNDSTLVRGLCIKLISNEIVKCSVELSLDLSTDNAASGAIWEFKPAYMDAMGGITLLPYSPQYSTYHIPNQKINSSFKFVIPNVTNDPATPGRDRVCVVVSLSNPGIVTCHSFSISAKIVTPCEQSLITN